MINQIMPFTRFLCLTLFLLNFIAKPEALPEPENPCSPSPCGPFSECRIVGGHPSCSCLKQYVGMPPNCKPECVINAHCSSSTACINKKCSDPCPYACGSNAQCNVNNHLPTCTCYAGYTGDPFTKCDLIPVEAPSSSQHDPCDPPCGSNAQCRNGACTCITDYQGDPYESCKPECVTNSECQNELACINNKCQNPCVGICGDGAICNVSDHIPTCTCPPTTTSDAFDRCRPYSASVEGQNSCQPSPCGPYSQCREYYGQAVCSCLPGYLGEPPSCRPECTVSSDCNSNKACMNQLCRDPCPGDCGIGAKCTIVNHNPICSCPPGSTGDAFDRCQNLVLVAPVEGQDPCQPSPCGPNSQCREYHSQAECSCLPGYLGPPPSCRPECTVNSDCSPDKACRNKKCTDPCSGECGIGAVCTVVNHNPICSCPRGYTGDPFDRCQNLETVEGKNPCQPSPCGPNSQCREYHRLAECSCLPEYLGSPPSCRPQCTTNSDCNSNKVCRNRICRDPCPGVCGIGAECTAANHRPICSCPLGSTGDPFVRCQMLPIEKEPIRSRRAAANSQTEPPLTKPGSVNAASIAQQNCKKYAEYRYVNKAKNSNTSDQSKEMDCINAVPLIVGGIQVEPKEFPHMALIGYGNDFKDVQWLCGGSLVSEKFVMSVAKCSDPGGRYGSAKWVLLGATNLNSTIDNGKPVVYEIVKRHVHPSYKSESLLHDISLFELNSTVTMSPYVRPACLYTSTSIPVGTKSSITGWGATARGKKRSESLLKATISILEDKHCETSYNIGNPNYAYDSKTMICAGDLVEGKDTCAGDSGGPLQIPVDNEVCMWNLLGITSFGAGCGNKKDAGVYTKVPYYLDWIQSIVWP